MAELSARLSEVSQEKARLESRNSVLEKVCTLQPEAAKRFLHVYGPCSLAQTSIQACAALASSLSPERIDALCLSGGEVERRVHLQSGEQHQHRRE